MNSKLLLPVYGATGEEVERVELPEEIFAVDASDDLIAQCIHVYLSNQRLGTASTKLRSEVSFTTKKVYRQKGTGLARHGSKRANLFRGGGVTFGPKPRDFSLKINKKQKRKALFASVTNKLKQGGLVGVDQGVFTDVNKTKSIVNLIQKMPFANSKQLYVFPGDLLRRVRSAFANIPRVSLTRAEDLNPYRVLTADTVIFTRESIDVFKSVFLKSVFLKK